MSRSELHDWECAIEALCGDNTDKMLAIAQDIYNTAFVRGKNCVLSVTPQRPKGNWIETSLTSISGGDFNRGFKCNCCDYVTVVDDFNYCPNCGAKMEVEE